MVLESAIKPLTAQPAKFRLEYLSYVKIRILLTNVFVNFNNLLNCGGLHQGRCNAFLHSQDNTLGSLDADRRGAKLDGFDGIFNL